MTDTATAPAPTAEERLDRFHTLREQSVQTRERVPRAREHPVGERGADDLGRARHVGAAARRAESGLLGHGDRRRRHRGRRRAGRRHRRRCAARTTRSPGRSCSTTTPTGTVIRGEDGQYALRVWDAKSEAIQEFGGISTFPYDPDWIVTGTFTPNPEGTTVGFSHLKDDGATRELPVPGDITVTIRGRRVPARRVQGRPPPPARLRGRDERRRHLRRRPLPLHRTEPRRLDHARLQLRGAAAVRVQLQLQLPACRRGRTGSRSASRRARSRCWARPASCCTAEGRARTRTGSAPLSAPPPRGRVAASEVCSMVRALGGTSRRIVPVHRRKRLFASPAIGHDSDRDR